MRSLNRELHNIKNNGTDTAVDEQYLVNSRLQFRNRRDRLVTHYDWMKKNRLSMLELL